MAVASTLSCCTPLMLSLSSAMPSGAVSATVSMSSDEPSRLSKKRRPAAHVTTMSHEYTERGVHISVVSRDSVMKACPMPSLAYRLRARNPALALLVL
jgi:hypothetical protein